MLKLSSRSTNIPKPLETIQIKIVAFLFYFTRKFMRFFNFKVTVVRGLTSKDEILNFDNGNAI